MTNAEWKEILQWVSYKKPFYLCTNRCILVHLHSCHLKGCPQHHREEGKACIVLLIWEMQEVGPERQGVDVSIISAPLNQALFFSLRWDFEKELLQRAKSVEMHTMRPMLVRDQEASTWPGFTQTNGWKNEQGGQRWLHTPARKGWHRACAVLDWSDEGPFHGWRPSGVPPLESGAAGSQRPHEHLYHVKCLCRLEKS